MQNSFDYSGNIPLYYSGNIKDLFRFDIPWINDISFIYSGDVGNFVCDVLNQNYCALVDKMEGYDYVAGIELLRTDSLDHDGREKIKETMIKEFSELDFSLVEKIAWEVFCSTEYETLSAKQKFFAFDRALCIATKEKNPFLQDIQVNLRLFSSGILELDPLELDSFPENISDIMSSNFVQIFEKFCAATETKVDLEDGSGLGGREWLRFMTMRAMAGRIMHFSSIKDIFIYLFTEMVGRNGMIKKCPNCGRFFSPIRRIDGTYCLYPSPQDPKKTCQEYISYANYLRKTQTDTATKLHKQIYNIKANRAKRNPDNDELWEDVETFLVRSRRWKIEVKNGSADEAQYIEWLQKIKEKDAQ